MIHVSVSKSGESYNRITVSGHSGYAESGSDVVCAAVSAIVINTVNSLERFTADALETAEDEARGLIDMKFPKGLGERGRLLVDSMVAGLEDIQKGSREFVEISYKEE